MSMVSLCMIVKNEEANLERCLSGMAHFMNEIIIVDTGSSDSTKEIAYRYTDKVYDYVWSNDFAAARNFSISKASNKYVLVLDGDEFMENIDIKEIRRLIHENPAKIGRLLLVDEYTRNGTLYKHSERISRLFSRKYYHYEGIIHEQVVPIVQSDTMSQNEQRYELQNNSTYLIPLTVRHSGYEGDLKTRQKKTDRNISLLKAALEEHPEDPYILYQLGKSYYMEEDYLSACEYFGQALYFDLDPHLEYVQDMVESYGYSLLNSKQYETSMQLLNIYEDFAHSADFIFLIGLILMNNGKYHQAIEEFQKAAKKNTAKMEGVNGYLAFYNIAVIYECLGEISNAIVYYGKSQDYQPALKRLAEIS